MTDEQQPRRVSVGDLAAEDVEALEDELGVPLPEWGSRGSVVRAMRRILEVGNGVPKGAYARMGTTAMARLVSMDDDPNP